MKSTEQFEFKGEVTLKNISLIKFGYFDKM